MMPTFMVLSWRRSITHICQNQADVGHRS